MLAIEIQVRCRQYLLEPRVTRFVFIFLAFMYPSVPLLILALSTFTSTVPTDGNSSISLPPLHISIQQIIHTSYGLIGYDSAGDRPKQASIKFTVKDEAGLLVNPTNYPPEKWIDSVEHPPSFDTVNHQGRKSLNVILSTLDYTDDQKLSIELSVDSNMKWREKVEDFCTVAPDIGNGGWKGSMWYSTRDIGCDLTY